MNLEDRDVEDDSLRVIPESATDLSDRLILSLYNHTIEQVTDALESYRFDEATRALYDFVWNSYCDWYVEMAKVRLNGDDAQARQIVQSVLCVVLEGTLRMMHPVAPFISEALWQTFPHEGEALMVAPWPKSDKAQFDSAAEEEMALMQDVVGAVRNIRGTMRIPPGKRVDVVLKTGSSEAQTILTSVQSYMKELVRIDNLSVDNDVERPTASASAVVGDVEIFVPLVGVIDLDVERQRLKKEIGGLEKALGGLEKKLNNRGFLSNAPAEVVAKEREKQGEYQDTLSKLQENLAVLSG